MEMVTTLEKVKNDIKARRSTAIYLCVQSLWWTHLESDIKESTRLGREYLDAMNKKTLADPKVTESDKIKLRELIAQNEESHKAKLDEYIKLGFPADDFIGTALSPCGFSLIKNTNPHEWFKNSLKMSKTLFAEHGHDVFIFTHHANCKKHFFNTYDKYIEVMEKQNKQ